MSFSESDVRLADEAGTAAWNALAEQVDALLDAWGGAAEPPSLAKFIPADPALRQMALCELIKVDLEQRWRDRRFPKLLEDYAAEFPDLRQGGKFPCDLVYEEYHVRRQAGEEIDQEAFLGRFPNQLEELGRLLGLEAPHVTTILSGREATASVDVGQTIDDFDLLTKLGKGAFASVFLARQRSMQRLVALKVSSDKGTEPQTLAQLDHPNIVRVYDQRQLSDQNVRLLYMQYVSGGTLHSVLDHLRKTGPPSGKKYLAAIDHALVERGEATGMGGAIRHRLEQANWPQVVCWLGARLAGALAYAHGRGVLHRDIKPANVLVAADGSPKLADFNISFSSKLSGTTPAAYFGGSLAYMSPEQLEACNPEHRRQPDELDGRTDLYSLGIMLWELLTGFRPFNDQGSPNRWSETLWKMTDLRRMGISAEVQARLPSDCPRGLKRVLLKCLSPRLDDRYANADDLARDLDLCLQPRAQRLLDIAPGSWVDWTRRHPLVCLSLLGLLPNVLMSGLNIFYNHAMIIQHKSADVQQVFRNYQLFGVNAVSYGLGLTWFFRFAWGLVQDLYRLARELPAPVERLERDRQICLSLGALAAQLSMSLWFISGLIFPFWINLQHGGQEMGRSDYVHFVASQTTCGLMAATLTYFVVTVLAGRVYYPQLVWQQSPQPSEARQLGQVERRSSRYFLVSVLTPFLAVFPTLLLEENRIAILCLGGLGLVATAISYWLWQLIRTDLPALRQVINPAGDTLGSGGDVTDSTWT